MKWTEMNLLRHVFQGRLLPEILPDVRDRFGYPLIIGVHANKTISSALS